VFESSRTNGNGCTVETVTVGSSVDDSDNISDIDNDSDIVRE